MEKRNPKNIRQSVIQSEKRERYRKLKEKTIETDQDSVIDGIELGEYALGYEVLKKLAKELSPDFVESCNEIGELWWNEWDVFARQSLKEHGLKVGDRHIGWRRLINELAIGVTYVSSSIDFEFSSYRMFIRGLLVDRNPLIPWNLVESSSNYSAPNIDHSVELSEAKLGDHFRTLFGNKAGLAEVESALREVANDSRKVQIVKKFADDHGCSELAVNIIAYSMFWLRDPLGFEASGQKDLIEYLFVKYTPPKFLYLVWQNEFSRSQQKWYCWFLVFAQGVSIKRLASHFGWHISRSFIQHLHSTPVFLSATEACMRAEILSMGGTELDFERVRRHQAYYFDPTELSESDSNRRFWQATVRWTIRNSEYLNDAECELVLDWAQHMFTEGAKTGATPFSWKGRSLRSVKHASREYRNSPNCAFAAHYWRNHGWDWSLQTDHQNWEIIELVSGYELYNEGEAMKHCVAGYAPSCANGICAIFSLRCNGIRRVTIELNLAKRELFQARGERNSSVSIQESELLAQWINTVVQRA